MTKLIQVRCVKCLRPFDIVISQKVVLASCVHCSTKLKFEKLGEGFITNIYNGDDFVPSAKVLVAAYKKSISENASETRTIISMDTASGGIVDQPIQEKEVPEWKTFTPKAGRAGSSVSRGLRQAVDMANIRGLNITALKLLSERLDEEKLNNLSFDQNGEWLIPYREVRYLTTRMWCAKMDPRVSPFLSVEEANQAVVRVSELLQPYLKP